MWRDDLGSGAAASGGGGWRLDAYGTWVWDEPSPLERPGAGIGALRARGGDDERARRDLSAVGDRALATLDRGYDDRVGDRGDPTPIFHELTVDRSRRVTRRPARRDREAVAVPEPHPGSGPLPVQDGGRGRGLREVPTVPPPPVAPEFAESPEDELRRRAERRRRPLGSAGETPREADREGGRHTWRREEVRTGRHALRR
ncbi:hypothetical protein [Actinomycetospora cinnamomea]|uniref:hypothetical protein n=1 Tax=Actinomycetospora cinnamomea TaxID=663609 RepID=UPI00105828EC|nr:hypothetical protein [Actinomycetospora cinnamomea]